MAVDGAQSASQAAKGNTRRPAGLGEMPPEIRLSILRHLPDVPSLLRATIASGPLHHTFTAYRNSVSTHVLKNEVPEHVWRHAIVADMLRNGEAEAPIFDSVDVDAITSRIGTIRQLRDDAPQARVSSRAALAISSLHTKVTELRDLFVDDCAYAKKQHFVPLWDSVRYRPPVASELVRIEQALYLFQMLASLCKNMAFNNKPTDRGYVGRCYDKVEMLQKCFAERLMAPWELYQVIAIQAYFRRAVHGFERDQCVSERVMPSMLVSGIDLMHEALCVVGHGGVDDFMAPYEKRFLDEPQHAFGVIVSRGLHKAWTRTQPRDFDEYAPFRGDADWLGYASWRKIEESQLVLVGTHQAWADLLHDRLMALEGRLDLWGAALWNDSRWSEIHGTVRRPEPPLWRDMDHHWSSMSVGFRVLADPWVLEESMAEEARARGERA